MRRTGRAGNGNSTRWVSTDSVYYISSITTLNTTITSNTTTTTATARDELRRNLRRRPGAVPRAAALAAARRGTIGRSGGSALVAAAALAVAAAGLPRASVRAVPGPDCAVRAAAVPGCAHGSAHRHRVLDDGARPGGGLRAVHRLRRVLPALRRLLRLLAPAGAERPPRQEGARRTAPQLAPRGQTRRRLRYLRQLSRHRVGVGIAHARLLLRPGSAAMVCTPRSALRTPHPAPPADR